jgi:hypothetical protein
MVPTSTNPNPKACKGAKYWAFLSKPAPNPTGLGNSIPETVLGIGLGYRKKLEISDSPTGMEHAIDKHFIENGVLPLATG